MAIPFVQTPLAYPSSITYQLSCATIYLTASNAAVIDTYNGYTVAMLTCGGMNRFCTVTSNLPSYAFNATQGLVGSWDGNPANDFVDRYGHDWSTVYPGNVDAAGYAFGLTWTVQANESFFTTTTPSIVECQITEDDNSYFAMGCLYISPGTVTNLLSYDVNVTSVLQSFDPSKLPTLPAVWSNSTLQSEAINRL